MVSRLADTDDYVSIVLAGEAGQGIQTVEHILARVLKLSGYNVFSSKEYMSRIRGGNEFHRDTHIIKEGIFFR
ncbi:hypothetical protein ES703_68128 [subsurface metagenome]